MKRRNNIFVCGSKFDLNYPSIFRLSLEYDLKLWTGNDLKIEINNSESEVEIKLFRSYGDNYVEQTSRVYEGDKLSPYIFMLDKILLLGNGKDEVRGKFNFLKYKESVYVHIDNFIEEYNKLAKKMHCAIPSEIIVRDNKEYVSLTLKF